MATVSPDHVRIALMVCWDPIGVCDVPEAQDEYDRYAPGVRRILERGASPQPEELAAHLTEVECTEMGSDRSVQAENVSVAKRIIRLVEYLGAQGSPPQGLRPGHSCHMCGASAGAQERRNGS